MSKLEERESRRRSATVGKFVEQPPMAATSAPISSSVMNLAKEDFKLPSSLIAT